MIHLHAESDPAHPRRLRVEIHDEVIGYLLLRPGGWWVATGPADAPLAGYATPLQHATNTAALSHLLAATGALARITTIEEAR